MIQANDPLYLDANAFADNPPESPMFEHAGTDVLKFNIKDNDEIPELKKLSTSQLPSYLQEKVTAMTRRNINREWVANSHMDYTRKTTSASL